ncbi:mas-related G-protein coupled receptor member H-like, partial [Eublepharis macularius]|uniref:Mas-related G-protein coupled receptor member H-like n=1 Tax=Eublepharis macularius TaxID=481883 RepID=A0AA97KPH0_EUBMA
MAEMTTAMLPLAGQSNNCWVYNGTECNNRVHTSTDGVIYMINQVICLFGLSGNGLVLWFLTFNIQKNSFIIYIFSLAVADFAFLLCCLFVITVFAAEYFGSYNFPLCTLMHILYKMELFLYSSSMYFLTAISTERCCCALFPIWYRSYWPKWGSVSVSAVLWSLAIVFSGVNIFYCSLWVDPVCQNMTTVITVVNLFIVTPFMILSSLALFIKVRYCLQQRYAGHLYTVILLTVLCFIIFAIPLSIQLFLRELGYCKLPKCFYLLASVNSGINPVIYFLVGSHREKQFREPLRYILYRALNEEKNSTL